MILDGRSRIDLRSCLTIRKEHIKPYACRQCSLAILSGNLNIDITESASAVSLHPSKDVPEDELLPRFQLESLASPFAFSVLELFNEADGSLGSLAVEVPSLVQSVLQIVIVPLDGKGNIFADQHFSVEDLLGVLFRWV